MKNIQASGTMYGEHITIQQISKAQARKLFDSNQTIYLQSSNMQPFGVWQSCLVCSSQDYVDSDFDYLCASYSWYNCDSERGKYIHFYKRIN